MKRSSGANSQRSTVKLLPVLRPYEKEKIEKRREQGMDNGREADPLETVPSQSNMNSIESSGIDRHKAFQELYNHPKLQSSLQDSTIDSQK